MSLIFLPPLCGCGGDRDCGRAYAVLRPKEVEIAAGDPDCDCDLDLVVANEGSDDLSILFNQGDGLFADGGSLPTGDDPEAVVLADLDGDGDMDIVVASEGSDDLVVYRNDGGGGFVSSVSYLVGRAPESVAVGDLDGDGSPDLVLYCNSAFPWFPTTTPSMTWMSLRIAADLGRPGAEPAAPAVARATTAPGTRTPALPITAQHPATFKAFRTTASRRLAVAEPQRPTNAPHRTAPTEASACPSPSINVPSRPWRGLSAWQSQTYCLTA